MLVGIPSPNPSYPQDIKVVTGDNNVVVCNKNILGLYLEGQFMRYATGAINTNEDYNSYIGAVIPNTTYVLSYNGDEPRFNISNLCFLDKNKQYMNGLAFTTGNTFTTPNNCYYIIIAIYKTITEYQIEKGSTATEYISHQEQSYTLHLGSLELYKIGDYQDVITGTKDNWKVVRNIGKVVYTGASEENWIYEQNNNGFLILNSLTNLKDLTNYDATKVPDFICNQYIPVSYNSYIGGSIGISERYFNNTDFLRCKSSLTDANAFKTYLSINNLIVYYPIATPIEETITDTTLINELNGLQELLSYDGTTNITITSDSNNAQMIVEITYTSESDMNEKLTNIFNKILSKLYHIIRAL